MSNSDMCPNEAHLSFINGVIARLNSNSFMIKGWCITIVSALLALLVATKYSALIVISVFPIISFSILDAMYLQFERRYTSLYSMVAKSDPAIVLFSMNANIESITKLKRNRFINVYRSKTIFGFYFPVLFMVLVLSCLLMKASHRSDQTQSTTTNIIQN